MHLLWIIVHLAGISTLFAFRAKPENDVKVNRKEENLILQLVGRLSELESRSRFQEKLIVDLQEELVDHKADVAALRDEIAEKTGLISTLAIGIESSSVDQEGYKNHTQNTASRSRRAVKANIAFTAGLSHSILHAPAYQNIIFDDVETNIGNGYNSRIGIFTAPVSGTYVFYTSILVYNNREIFCRIVVNGVNKANAYARGTDNRLDQGSQLIVVQLHQGDQVAVQNKMDDDAIFGNADIWTTFSGFLLHSDVLVG